MEIEPGTERDLDGVAQGHRLFEYGMSSVGFSPREMKEIRLSRGQKPTLH